LDGLVVRFRRQAIALMAVSVGQSFLVGCVSPPPPIEAPRQDLETRPVGFDISHGGIGPSNQPDVGSSYATSQPCDGFSSPVPSDAGVHSALGVDAGTVNGRLDPSLIQHVVRTHFGAMRLCYEKGLRRNPNLAGKVTTKFVIGLDGAVMTAGLACTSMPDDIAVDCVVDEFTKLAFPTPKGGAITVIYPIIFNPSN
jgi:Ca-activated chloride channel family protein